MPSFGAAVGQGQGNAFECSVQRLQFKLEGAVSGSWRAIGNEDSEEAAGTRIARRLPTTWQFPSPGILLIPRWNMTFVGMQLL